MINVAEHNVTELTECLSEHIACLLTVIGHSVSLEESWQQVAEISEACQLLLLP